MESRAWWLCQVKDAHFKARSTFFESHMVRIGSNMFEPLQFQLCFSHNQISYVCYSIKKNSAYVKITQTLFSLVVTKNRLVLLRSFD